MLGASNSQAVTGAPSPVPQGRRGGVLGAQASNPRTGGING